MKIATLKSIALELSKEISCLRGHLGARKIFFDHIPKCGGTSLSVYLKAHYLWRKTFHIDHKAIRPSVRKFMNLSQTRRYGYDLVLGHRAHDLLDYIHPEALKITVLRDPIDRIISYYYAVKQYPDYYLYSLIHSKKINLTEFARSDYFKMEIKDWYTLHFSGLSYSEAERAPQEAVEKALEVLFSRYDLIGVLDNFDSFTKDVCSHAKLKDVYDKKKLNVTEERPSLSDLSKSALKQLEDVVSLDIVFYRAVKKRLDLN